jgi:hypothetical protein
MHRPTAIFRNGAKRHAWVCVLLAFLFLYNPFLVPLGSGTGLNVLHPASHRATVGSSELDKYSSPKSQSVHVFVSLFFAKAFSFLPDRVIHSFLPQVSELLPPQLKLRASLWVRPPPAA